MNAVAYSCDRGDNKSKPSSRAGPHCCGIQLKLEWRASVHRQHRGILSYRRSDGFARRTSIASCLLALQRARPCSGETDDDITHGDNRELPPGPHHQGRLALLHDGWAVEGLAGDECVAVVDGRGMEV